MKEISSFISLALSQQATSNKRKYSKLPMEFESERVLVESHQTKHVYKNPISYVFTPSFITWSWVEFECESIHTVAHPCSAF